MSSTAHALVARVRSRWRRNVIVRGAFAAAAVLLACISALVLVDQIASLSVPARALLRFLPPGLALVTMIVVARAAFTTPSAQRVALLIEERDPQLAGVLTTLLALQGDGIVARAFKARAERVVRSTSADALAVTPLRPTVIRSSAIGGAALLVAFVTTGSAAEVWRRWGSLLPGPPAAALAAGRADVLERARAEAWFQDVRVRVLPPAYTGIRPYDPNLAQPITVVAGTVLEVSGTVPFGAGGVSARWIAAHNAESGGGFIPVHRDDMHWTARLQARSLHRGIDLHAHAAETSAGDGDVVARRIIAFTVTADREPRVDLQTPAADLLLARAAGTITISASAADDFGVESLAFTWILSRGGGESFTFTEGEWSLNDVRRASHGMRGAYQLELASLDIEAGDVLHVRAVARDGNYVTGPGVGVSRTRLIRIAREDELGDVTSLIGFPLEAEKQPMLSQRMIILLTERLIEQLPTLDSASVLLRSEEIAREQARLREHVADVIYSTQSDEGDEHAAAEPVRQAPLVTAADSALRRQELLDAATRATGRGTLAELSHQHDPNPALALDRKLLAAFNAMYDAERALRLGEPQSALPHEYRALEVLQAVREADRVFLRGRQSVAPVDVAGTRGTGTLDDAAPGERAPAREAPRAAPLVAEIGALAEQLVQSEPRTASLALSALTAKLLADGALDPRAGALLTRAADAARQGRLEDARSLALQARTLLARASATVGPTSTPAAATATEVAYLARLAVQTSPAEPRSIRTPVTNPFVFATVRYESGDWDSGQLVPANLIHSIALYTDIAVAPEGVVVDLSSTEIFRYPVLYLTGHLPVRFSATESANLLAYVERGGLIFIDDHNHDIDGAFHRTATAELTRIFGEGALRELPNDHELYRAFFVFEDGPPTTSHELNGWGDGLVHDHLLAVQRDGRVGVLYSNKDYSSEWSYHVQNKRFLAIDHTRFGVNLIVYALTR